MRSRRTNQVLSSLILAGATCAALVVPALVATASAASAATQASPATPGMVVYHG